MFHRRSIRLKNHDYSSDGMYFVTICTRNRACLFGEIYDDEMSLNTLGCIIDEEWLATSTIRPYVTLDAYVIMPNHLHGLIIINRDSVGATWQFAPTNGPRKHSLGAIIAQFKRMTTLKINHIMGNKAASIWQRNYYEHIVRSETSLHHIRQYILANPTQWSIDLENPQNQKAHNL